jgi:hypothetical protein
MKSIAWISGLTLGLWLGGATGVTGSPPLGHRDFYPSPEHPVGFLGDGSAAFPGATPVAVWAERGGIRYVQSENNTGTWAWDSEKPVNIVWKTSIPRPDLPYRGVIPRGFEGQSHAGVIIVGDRAVTTADPYFLYGFDMNTGKELWRADCNQFDLMPRDQAERALALLSQDPWKAWDEAFGKKGQHGDPTFDKPQTPEVLRELNRLGVKFPLPTNGKDVYFYTGSAYATPVSDGRHIWAAFQNCMVVCYDLDGKRRWAKWDYKLTNRSIGYGHLKSPLLVGDTLIVDLGYANDGTWRDMQSHGITIRLAAFDKHTGTKKWEREQRMRSSHACASGQEVPLWVKVGEQRRSVVYSATAGELYDPETGAVLVSEMFYTEGHATPVVNRDQPDTFYLPVSPEGGASQRPEAYRMHAVQVLASADGTFRTTNLWSVAIAKRGQTSGSGNRSPAYWNGRLYRHNEMDGDKRGGLVWLVEDGKVVGDFPGLRRSGNPRWGGWGGYGSSTLAGNKVYMFVGSFCQVSELIGDSGDPKKSSESILLRDGDLTGKPVNGDERRGSQLNGFPFFSGNRLVYRTHENLYCIGNPDQPYDWNPASRAPAVEKVSP